MKISISRVSISLGSAIIAVFAVLLMPLSQVHAAIFYGGEQYTLEEHISVAENMYLAGSTISLLGSVVGDVVAAGSVVHVAGSVGGDVLASGNTITVTGPVQGDIRAAGGTVIISGEVRGDVIVFGGTVQILPSAILHGSVRIYGGSVTLDGVIEQMPSLGGGIVEIGATLRSGATIEAGRHVVIKDTAVLEGMVEYEAPSEALIGERAQIPGTLVHTPSKEHRSGLGMIAGAVTLFALLKLLMSFVLAAVVVGVFPAFTRAVVGYAQKEPLNSTVVGAVSLIAIPIVAILLMITIIGLGLGIALLAGYVVLIIITKAIAGCYVGTLLSKWTTKEATISIPWTFLGLFVLFIVCLIPVLGWLICLLALCIALGALIRFMYERIWLKRR